MFNLRIDAKKVRRTFREPSQVMRHQSVVGAIQCQVSSGAGLRLPWNVLRHFGSAQCVVRCRAVQNPNNEASTTISDGTEGRALCTDRDHRIAMRIAFRKLKEEADVGRAHNTHRCKYHDRCAWCDHQTHRAHCVATRMPVSKKVPSRDSICDRNPSLGQAPSLLQEIDCVFGCAGRPPFGHDVDGPARSGPHDHAGRMGCRCRHQPLPLELAGF